MNTAKDPTLVAVLRQLRKDLGPNAFVVEDHWEADLNAVGIARPSDRRFLIYIATWPEVSGLSFQCEFPASDGDMPYESADMIDGATYEQLLSAARLHLLGE
jgi:hypothetical protein